jgi:hypothetical protein
VNDASNTQTGNTPPPEPQAVQLTDADVRNIMTSAVRLLVVLAAVAAALFCWRAGWQSAVLVLVGAGISAMSLWDWLRLATAINRRMDAGEKPRPVGAVVFGFVSRLALTLAVLYVSLKYLHGTIFALATGLGLGLISLSIEAFRLLRRTT